MGSDPTANSELIFFRLIYPTLVSWFLLIISTQNPKAPVEDPRDISDPNPHITGQDAPPMQAGILPTVVESSTRPRRSNRIAERNRRRSSLQGDREVTPNTTDASSDVGVPAEDVRHLAVPAPPPAAPKWAAPSRSKMKPTAVLPEHASESRLGFRAEDPFRELFLSRIEGNRETRARLPQRRETLIENVRDQLMGARSDGRWTNMSSAWKQFVAWIPILEEEGTIPFTVAWQICMFVQAKLDEPPKTRRTASGALEEVPSFLHSSAHEMVKNLVQTAIQLGMHVDTVVTRDYKASLKRKGALRPTYQAPPATIEDIVNGLNHLSEEEKVGLMIAWLTASRIGEMQHLVGESFARGPNGLLIITFPYHKGDPYRLGTTIPVVVPPAWERAIWTRVRGLATSEKFTPLTTARAEAILQKVRPELGAHSVKRGALVMLLRAGVPLTLIQQIAKHKDLETLFRYLPRDEVALAMNLQQASMALGAPLAAGTSHQPSH